MFEIFAVCSILYTSYRLGRGLALLTLRLTFGKAECARVRGQS